MKSYIMLIRLQSTNNISLKKVISAEVNTDFKNIYLTFAYIFYSLVFTFVAGSCGCANPPP